MGFCRFSSEYLLYSTTAVDNAFINDFLPSANAECIKVYLYGLLRCSNAAAYDNTLENFASVLGLSTQDVEDAFLYWQDQGLVQVISSDPIEVVYMAPSKAISSTKKYDTEKYREFNTALESIIKDRPIEINEYYKYYEFIETYHFEPSALILIIGYCEKIKGQKVNYGYVLSIAKTWADENITSYQKVEAKLAEIAQDVTEIGDLFKILGIKRLASAEEKDLLSKWKYELDFSYDTIKDICKMLKKSVKRSLNFERIDSYIMKYYEMKLFSISEIKAYEEQKEKYYNISKAICRELGVYYDNMEPVINNYITKWSTMGYEEDILKQIANICFKSSIKTLEGMNTYILKLYKLGIVTEEALSQYVSAILADDDKIKELLQELGIVRNVNKFDRDFYHTWTIEWNMSNELIQEGVKLSKDKSAPMQYLNKILSFWHTNDVKKVEDISKYKLNDAQNAAQAKPKETKKFIKRDYSKVDLNALFDNLEEIDL